MVLRIVLGVVYLAMGAGQLLSWRQMPAILDAYQAVPTSGLPALAGLLIASELLVGAWFVLRPRSRSAAPVWVYTAVAMVWTVLGVQAYARGVAVDNCGCFGVYLSQRLSWFTLLQDGLLLVYAALMLRSATTPARHGAAVEAVDHE